MSRSVMYPSDLTAILRKAAGGRLFVGATSDAEECQSEKKRPDGMIYFHRDWLAAPVAISRCARNVMAAETQKEPDPWWPERTWQRIGWKKVLKRVCHNGNIPVPIREKVYAAAQKAGYDGFMTRADYWAMVT